MTARLRLRFIVVFTFVAWATLPAFGNDRKLTNLFNEQRSHDQYFKLDMNDLARLPRPEMTRKRQHWWPSESEPLEKWENRGTKFTGFFHGSHEINEFWTRPGIPSHMVFFGDYPHATETRPMLACYIPFPELHPTWKLRTLNTLSTRNVPVTIYGRLLWENYRTKNWVFILEKIEIKENNIFRPL